MIADLWSKSRRFVFPAIALVIFLGALFVLHRIASEVSWAEVKSDIASLSWTTIGLALLFTAISYFAFSLYDVLALRAIAPGRVPARVAIFAGASGYAVSNLLGFSYITGPAIRARIYSGYKLDLALIATVVASIWIFFWVGIAIMLAVMLFLHQDGVGVLSFIPLSLRTATGAVILIAIAAILVWLGRKPRTLSFRSISLPLPGTRIALAQSLIGIVDMTASSAVLYILLPSDLATGFPAYFVIYVGAIALGIASHAPGGVGVFEATMMAGLGASGRADVLAALVVYRLVYYVMPVGLAAIAMALAWVFANRRSVSAAGRQVHRLAGHLIPPISAALALATGVVLTVSGSLPAEMPRLRALDDVIPLPLIEISHLAGSVVGVLLIVVSRSLFRRQHKAWVAAVGLLLVGMVASLSRGLDWEEAAVMAFALVLLISFRSVFYRAADQSILTLSPRWLFASVMVLGFAIWVGLAAYSNVAYRNELWWRVALDGDAPRYLRASLAAAVVLIAVGVNSLLASAGRRLTAEGIPDAVRALIAASDNAEANIHLTGDKRFLLSDDNSAFIGYADTGHSLISKGSPIGDHKAGIELIWQLREMADRMGRKCAFYAVGEDYLPTYLDLGCSMLKIGEVARVDLRKFTLEGPAQKGLRYARSKAAREGYRFEVVPRAEVPDILEQTKTISDTWLKIKSGAEKDFALGRFDEAYLRNFDFGILRHAETGRIAAFANLFQSGEKAELSLDLMRYDPEAPSVVMDALLAELMMWGRAEGFSWFSLGAAPLSGLPDHRLATTWNRLGSYVYEHGGEFYHFEGLRAFKQKFDPVWSPNYIAIAPGANAARILYEVNGLISGGIRGLL